VLLRVGDSFTPNFQAIVINDSTVEDLGLLLPELLCFDITEAPSAVSTMRLPSTPAPIVLANLKDYGVGSGAFKRKESVALVNDLFSAEGLRDQCVEGYVRAV
jgi:hypothetical protein